ncbi:hypothetical protein SNE40_014351 [Patella caerulea]|uniref:DUF3504 domain-containing protein n=1 Tax=Patella caerulea TaxID=87958 RepID=A0AAN8PH43_PATCE
MTPAELNIVLKHFLFEAKKCDGGDYPSSTLYDIVAAVQSYIRYTGKSVNIFEDDDFEQTRKALDTCMKEKAAMGLGISNRQSAEIITLEEEENLWKRGVLGSDTPAVLLDTIFYLTGLHFSLRGGQEHRSLRLFDNPQITGPHMDSNEKRFLLYKEEVSKTNSGGLKSRKSGPKIVRAYENPDQERCYVHLFEKYKSLCDTSSTKAFYFTPLKIRRPNQWFSKVPIGHNTLQNFIKRMCSAAGFRGKRTNHSLRATSATRLYQMGVDEQQICEQTGHKSEADRTYKRTSDRQKSDISNYLYGKVRKLADQPLTTKLDQPQDDQPHTSTQEDQPHKLTQDDQPQRSVIDDSTQNAAVDDQIQVKLDKPLQVENSRNQITINFNIK